jgi:hypothetical protein
MARLATVAGKLLKILGNSRKSRPLRFFANFGGAMQSPRFRVL